MAPLPRSRLAARVRIRSYAVAVPPRACCPAARVRSHRTQGSDRLAVGMDRQHTICVVNDSARWARGPTVITLTPRQLPGSQHVFSCGRGCGEAQAQASQQLLPPYTHPGCIQEKPPPSTKPPSPLALLPLHHPAVQPPRRPPPRVQHERGLLTDRPRRLPGRRLPALVEALVGQAVDLPRGAEQGGDVRLQHPQKAGSVAGGKSVAVPGGGSLGGRGVAVPGGDLGGGALLCPSTAGGSGSSQHKPALPTPRHQQLTTQGSHCQPSHQPPRPYILHSRTRALAGGAGGGGRRPAAGGQLGFRV